MAQRKLGKLTSKFRSEWSGESQEEGAGMGMVGKSTRGFGISLCRRLERKGLSISFRASWKGESEL